MGELWAMSVQCRIFGREDLYTGQVHFWHGEPVTDSPCVCGRVLYKGADDGSEPATD